MRRRLDRHFLLGILALFLVFGGYGLAAAGWLRAPFEPSTRTAQVSFANTANLVEGAPVRVHGVEVGTVASVDPSADRRSSVVRLKLTDDAPRLTTNATAALRWRLVLGGSYQVELNPGSGAQQRGTEVIDLRRSTSQVEIDQVVATLRSDQRAGIRSILNELPRAFLDRDAPARALNTLTNVAPRLSRVLRSVRGEQPDRDLRRLLTTASRTVRALDAPAAPVRAVVEGAASTLQTIAARGSDLSATIDRADVVLPRIRTTLQRLDTTLGAADPTLRTLLDPAGDVAPTARELRPTVLAADHLLRQARPLLRRLRPAASALQAVSSDGLPLLEGLEPSLRRLDARILPDLALVDKTSKRPTYQMIGPTVASFNAVAGSLDEVSHLAALDGASGDPKVDTSGCSTYLSDLKPGQLVNCETLLRTLGRLIGQPPRRSR